MATEPTDPTVKADFGRDYLESLIQGSVHELRDTMGYRYTYEYLLKLAGEMCYPQADLQKQLKRGSVQNKP